jgi:hypothetical protein
VVINSASGPVGGALYTVGKECRLISVSVAIKSATRMP